MLSYLLFTLTIGGMYAMLAMSLNLVWGCTGLVNLGLAGFFAVGAYATAILTGADAPILAGWGFSILCGVVAGFIVTFATLRLRSDYLAIVTLGFGEIVRLVALNETWLTNGANGISGIRAPLRETLGQQGFQIFYLVLVTVIAVATWMLLRRIDLSPYGRVLKAIREDQELARFAGKNVLRFKFQAFALGSAIAAFAGALYAHYQSYVSPDHFQPLITIYIFLAVTAGGVGRPVGALLGGYAVVAFLEATRFIAEVVPGLSPVQLASIREILVGAALLLLLILRPNGLLTEVRPTAERYRVPASQA